MDDNEGENRKPNWQGCDLLLGIKNRIYPDDIEKTIVLTLWSMLIARGLVISGLDNAHLRLSKQLYVKLSTRTL